MKKQIDDRKSSQFHKKIDKEQNKKENYLKALIKSINEKHINENNL